MGYGLLEKLRHGTLHGLDVRYGMAGKDPVIVLIHGMAGSSCTWLDVVLLLDRTN
jgi:pimeloyl-ACP methyl ester carboxylesterase